jgi:hypothetical protein
VFISVSSTTPSECDIWLNESNKMYAYPSQGWWQTPETLSILEGRHQEDCGLRPAQVQSHSGEYDINVNEYSGKT